MNTDWKIAPSERPNGAGAWFSFGARIFAAGCLICVVLAALGRVRASEDVPAAAAGGTSLAGLKMPHSQLRHSGSWLFESNAAIANHFMSEQNFSRNALTTERFSDKCGVSNPSPGGLATVSEEDVPVFLMPKPKAEPLLGPDGKARRLDPRYDLRIMEMTPEWVRVAVVSPKWPPGNAGWMGWVERRKIQRVESEDQQKCLFVDVSAWKNPQQANLASIRDVALQILRDDARCKRISRGDFVGKGRSFYLTCYPSDGGKPYHYWMSSSEDAKNFALPAMMDQDAAIDRCKSELEQNLRNSEIADGRPAQGMSFMGAELVAVDHAYYVTMDYRLGEQARKSYCFVGPRKIPEISHAE